MQHEIGVMTLFRDKYRSDSRRLREWDYRTSGKYFITICAGGMNQLFGRVERGAMVRNVVGEIAQQMWIQIPDHHKDVSLDEFVVMPNHVHGIIVLSGQHGSDVARNVATKNQSNSMSRISPKPGSLGAIVRSYKSAVSNRCHVSGYPDFIWQPRFHDHIIRNNQELNTIRQYILNNPTNWEHEKNSPAEFAAWMD